MAAGLPQAAWAALVTATITGTTYVYGSVRAAVE
jgi:hypothetical protein